MAHADFNLKALYDALDEQRRSRETSRAAVAREVNHFHTEGHPIATSTVTGLRDKPVVVGAGILQMLLWLHRTPESFVPGSAGADAERYRLRVLPRERELRWATRALRLGMSTQRQARGMTWRQVAQEMGGFTPGMLTNLAKGGRIGFPRVRRMVRCLGQPAAALTRAAEAWGHSGADDRKRGKGRGKVHHTFDRD